MQYTDISKLKFKLYTIIRFIFAAHIPALYDLWVIGDNFLKDIRCGYQSLQFRAEKDPEFLPPFIDEMFNVHLYDDPKTLGLTTAVARALACLIDAAQERRRLPKYLLVIMDKDIINDVKPLDEYAPSVLQDVVRYFVRQVDMIMRRKKINSLDKKPGALTGFTPKVIFVRMLWRVGSFHKDSRMYMIANLRAKFNDCLNDAIAKIDQYILTITSCNTYEHFDVDGNLSSKGKKAFWLELDNLIDRF